MELEKDNRYNSMYFTINELKNKHDLSIFYKPYHTDITVHYSSLNPYQKTFSSIYGLISIDHSQVNFKKELNIIKRIALNIKKTLANYIKNISDTLNRNKNQMITTETET